MSRWFRLYDDVLDDPKVQALAPALFKCWVNVLCAASKNNGQLPPLAQLAFKLRKSERAMAADLAELKRAGLIDDDGDGGMAPHNWAARQFKSDKSADRVRRHRERTREAATCNVTSAVTETTPDTETDTETEIIRFPSVPVAARQAREQTVKMVSSKAFPATGSIAFVEPWASIAKRCRPGVDVDVMAEKFRRWCPTKGVDLGVSNIAERFASFCRTDAKTSARAG